MTPLIAILIIVAIIGVAMYKRSIPSGDITVYPVPTPRTDLLYGYYGCADAQVAETKDHVNLLHESQFDGPDKCIQNILDADVFTILDVSSQVFDHGIVKPTAETDLALFFGQLAARGALKNIKAIYPIDEPNNTTTPVELAKAIALIKHASYGFKDLAGVVLAVIYAADKPFICQESFDYVGFDDYSRKSSILRGQYQDLCASLLPFQKTILVPGGAYGQDPTPFVNWAESDPRVAILMPFLWLDERIDPATGRGSVGAPGIRSGALKQKYIDAGKYITGRV
jgi:hypothetical protein